MIAPTNDRNLVGEETVVANLGVRLNVDIFPDVDTPANSQRDWSPQASPLPNVKTRANCQITPLASNEELSAQSSKETLKDANHDITFLPLSGSGTNQEGTHIVEQLRQQSCPFRKEIASRS